VAAGFFLGWLLAQVKKKLSAGRSEMITFADIKASWRLIRWWPSLLVAVLCVLLANSRSDVATLKSDNDVLRSDNTLQGRLSLLRLSTSTGLTRAENASRLNSLIDASSDKTVIEYREILRREKTCDLPVPADVAGGLLSYANRLRASAMHTDSGNADAAGDSATHQRADVLPGCSLDQAAAGRYRKSE
jgi:hypothetical protein